MILEIFINLLTPFPYFDFDFQMILLGSEIYFRFMTFLYILSFLKIYLLFRLIGIYSRFTDSLSEKYCRSHGIGAGVIFAIKSIIKEAPFKTVMFFLLVLTFLLGIIVRMLEVLDPNSRDNYTHFSNGFWQIIIALTTVGYGEIFPITHLGRFTVLLGVFLGTFLVSVSIVALTTVSSFSKEELKAYSYLKDVIIKKRLKYYYQVLIKCSFKIYKIRTKLGSNQKRLDLDIDYIGYRRKKMSVLQKITELKRELGQESFVNEDDMFMELQSKIEEEISLIKIGLKHINKYKDTMSEQLKLQNEFIKTLKLNSKIFKKTIKNPLVNFIINKSSKDEETLDTNKNKSKEETIETDNFYPREFKPSVNYKRSANMLSEETDLRGNPQDFDVFKLGSAESYLSKIFNKENEIPEQKTKNLARLEEQYENYYYQWASNESRVKLLKNSNKTSNYLDQLSLLYKKNNSTINTIIKKSNTKSMLNSPIPLKLEHEIEEDGLEAIELVKDITEKQKKIDNLIQNYESHKQKKNNKNSKK